MIALVPLHSLAILGVALPAASSYWMDPSCNPYNLNREIDDSLQEAVDMAAYGLWRVHQEPPFMGSLADQMVGNQGANGMDGKDIFAGM